MTNSLARNWSGSFHLVVQLGKARSSIAQPWVRILSQRDDLEVGRAFSLYWTYLTLGWHSYYAREMLYMHRPAEKLLWWLFAPCLSGIRSLVEVQCCERMSQSPWKEPRPSGISLNLFPSPYFPMLVRISDTQSVPRIEAPWHRQSAFGWMRYWITLVLLRRRKRYCRHLWMSWHRHHIRCLLLCWNQLDPSYSGQGQSSLHYLKILENSLIKVYYLF